MTASRNHQRTAIEIVFWFSLLTLIVPRIVYEHYDRSLRESLDAAAVGPAWTAHGAGMDGQVVRVPHDYEKLFAKGFDRIRLETTVQRAAVARLHAPALFLGRIADSDEVRLDGCLVGKTGLDAKNAQKGWWWGVLRNYPIPEACLGGAPGSDYRLSVTVYKWGGPSFGIYSGPVGIGEADALADLTQNLDLLQYGTTFLYGLMILAVGLYYLFIFLLIPAKRYNGVYSACAMAIGIFLLATSTYPYRWSGTAENVMRINLLSASLVSFSLVLFLAERLNVIPRWVTYFSGISSVVLGTVGSLRSSLNGIYQVYQIWFPFFLLSFFIALGFTVSRLRAVKLNDSWRYLLALAIFTVACLHDVFTTVAGLGWPYLVSYGFVGLLGTVSLTLAKESADAFLHVEAQVQDRTRDLALALDQLRSLDKMKERFFANISHDFKTPIAVALGTLEEMKNKISAISLRDFLPAERSLSQLLRMVGDILDVVKAESGTLRIDWKRAKPAELLAEWADSYRILCDKKGLTLKLEIDGFEGLVVPMDVPKVHRAVENVVSNAIKFTEADPRRANVVEIRLRCDDARVYVDVSDSGMGIPAADRDKVFDRYYQSSNVSLKNYGGSGIGLSFVKEVLESMNGDVTLAESAYGGSRFTLSLPLSQDVEITGEYLSSNAKEVQATLRGSLDVAYPAERPKKEENGRARVLFAEDNPEVAHVIHQALSDDYNLHFASNGARALDRAKEEPFDCVLTDVIMPVMRGDELVPKLRVEALDRNVPIIVLSSQGDEDTVTELLKNGANDFVVKPFRREILRARVHAQIMAHRTSRWIAQNEKVIELGFLAGGMAHQIRNGLHNLKNQVHYQEKLAESLLTDATNLPEEQQQKLRKNLDRSKDAAKRALDRIEGLTDSVRTYSTGSQQAAEIKVRDSIDLALALHEERIRQNGVLVEKRGVDGLAFLGYASFHEVLVNLIGNAIDACPAGGTGRIELTGREDGAFIELRIRDNGSGIEAASLSRLFAPFFTTKPPEQGTGLGLYVARDVIEGQHKGALTVESQGAGLGATFTIRVPKVAPKAVHDAEVLVHNVSVS